MTDATDLAKRLRDSSKLREVVAHFAGSRPTAADIGIIYSIAIHDNSEAAAMLDSQAAKIAELERENKDMKLRNKLLRTRTDLSPEQFAQRMAWPEKLAKLQAEVERLEGDNERLAGELLKYITPTHEEWRAIADRATGDGEP